MASCSFWLVCLLVFLYRDEIGISELKFSFSSLSSSSQKPLHRGEWGELRSRVINISSNEDPLVMIALFNEYEEKLQAELTEDTTSGEVSSSGIPPIQDLTCELGMIHRKLADISFCKEMIKGTCITFMKASGILLSVRRTLMKLVILQ